jgi:hypothetical protein
MQQRNYRASIPHPHPHSADDCWVGFDSWVSTLLAGPMHLSLKPVLFTLAAALLPPTVARPLSASGNLTHPNAREGNVYAKLWLMPAPLIQARTRQER